MIIALNLAGGFNQNSACLRDIGGFFNTKDSRLKNEEGLGYQSEFINLMRYFLLLPESIKASKNGIRSFQKKEILRGPSPVPLNDQATNQRPIFSTCQLGPCPIATK